jgi:hypothetical protein
VKNIDVAVPAAAQHTGPGVSPLSAAMPDAGGFSLPVAWCATSAASVKRPRLVSRQAAQAARVQALAAATKPGQTNNRNHVYMTRVNADGDGASGPHPPREPA